MWKVREIADKVTNVVMNYTDIESKVREATNDDPWGPTGTIKHELSQATYSYDQFPEVMGMLWKRIAENKRSPRRIYKSLLLLHHLLLHGSDRVVRAAQDRLYEIRSLQDYHVIYEPGFNLDAIIPPSGTETKDGELNVRVKAKEMVDLVQDEEKLREERKKARKNRDKYVGIGSDKMMTSKWTDNDYSGGYDDEYGKKSRSPSPSSRSNFKPFSDSEPEFKKSSSSNSFNNNHTSFNRTKPAPPSPGLEISDDFDPRAEEKSSADFGDFASAPTPTTGKSPQKTFSFTNQKAATEGGDFADFQSAFGDSVSSTNSIINLKSDEPQVSSSKSEDLLGLTLDLSSAPQPLNNASLLTEDLFSNSNSGLFPAFGSTTTTLPSTPSPVGGLGQFPSAPGVGFPMAQSIQNVTLQSQMPSQSPVMDFGGNIMTPILEPAKTLKGDATSVPNHTSSNNNNNSKQSLQGTTWSDLNISIDDLNLGRSNSRNTAGTKTPMNQLKANNTTNSLGGLL